MVRNFIMPVYPHQSGHILKFRQYGKTIADYVEKGDFKKRDPALWKKKRIFDVCVAGPAYAVTSPLIFLAGLAVKLESKGPMLFKQKRTGYKGKEFMCYKLRTYTDTPPPHNKITKTGQLLRKSSIDELPQLLNVLKGDMTLIGPRAAPLEDVVKLVEINSKEALKRFCTKSGFGCGKLSDKFDFTKKFKSEQNYLRNWSLKTELNVFKNLIKKVIKFDNC